MHLFVLRWKLSVSPPTVALLDASLRPALDGQLATSTCMQPNTCSHFWLIQMATELKQRRRFSGGTDALLKVAKRFITNRCSVYYGVRREPKHIVDSAELLRELQKLQGNLSFKCKQWQSVLQQLAADNPKWFGSEAEKALWVSTMQNRLRCMLRDCAQAKVKNVQAPWVKFVFGPEDQRSGILFPTTSRPTKSARWNSSALAVPAQESDQPPIPIPDQAQSPSASSANPPDPVQAATPSREGEDWFVSWDSERQQPYRYHVLGLAAPRQVK